MTAAVRGLPEHFVAGEKRSDGSGVDLATTQNVRWVARLGSETYSSPTVAGGRVFIGSNDSKITDPRYKSTGGGQVLCLDEKTGKLLWRLVVPKLQSKWKSRQYDELTLGICSAVTVDGEHAYVVTNRCEVLCMNVQGTVPAESQRRGGIPLDSGPARIDPADADVVWRYDILKEQHIWPHDAAASSILVHGDLLYVSTCNGVDLQKCPAPLAPTLLVLDKRTGRLVGWDDEKIGSRVYHGQWSSPSLGEVDGRTLVFLGGGDGICYAFEAPGSVPAKPAALTKVWSFQCNPENYRFCNGAPIKYWDGDARFDHGNKDDGQYVGPSEIIATPVFYHNHVYVAVGQDPSHGRGRGILNCIDATKTGDISQSGKAWSYDRLDRSLSTVSIAAGLLYIADRPGVIHCLDADSGKCMWTYDTHAEIWGSTIVTDGRLYVGTRKGLYVMAAGRERNLLGKVRVGGAVWSTPSAANGTLYIAGQSFLWAVQDARHRHLLAATPGKTPPGP